MATVLDRFRPARIEAEPFEIERGVPLLRRRGGAGRSPVYPFGQMEVGDSIFIPTTSAYHPARSAAYAYARRKGVGLTVRSVTGGFRIWRTA